MEFKNVIKSRYSCKKYDSSRQLNKQQLDAIVATHLGFAAEGAGPLPNHFSRKPLAETVCYL